MNCNYCNKSNELLKVMTPICELSVTDVYFLHDQTYPGRCVVALKGHKEEIHELDEVTRNMFFKDLSDVSRVLDNIYSPEKLNIAVYGDSVKHLHFHVVPKYLESPKFGDSFILNAEKPVNLTEEEKNKQIENIKSALKK